MDMQPSSLLGTALRYVPAAQSSIYLGCMHPETHASSDMPCSCAWSSFHLHHIMEVLGCQAGSYAEVIAQGSILPGLGNDLQCCALQEHSR